MDKSLTEIDSEFQYPSEISIRGRTKHWFTYTVQEVKFIIDGFNNEGRPIYMGYQKKSVPSSTVQSEPDEKDYVIIDETDAHNLTRIYLTHD